MIVRDAVVFAMNGYTQLTYMNSCEQTCSAALPTVLAAFEHVPSLLHIRQPLLLVLVLLQKHQLCIPNQICNGKP